MKLSLEEIAELCHSVNKAFCESIGDMSQPTWDEAPDWQKNSAINGVRFHMENDRTPEESHENWLRQKQAEGWQYGEVKDPVAKTHPCLLPYDQLPVEQKAKDYIFKAICDYFRPPATY